VLEVAAAGRTPEAVIPYLGAAAREHVLEKAVEECHAGKSHTPHLLAPVVPIAEGDLAVGDAFQAAVGDRNPEDVPPEVGEHLLPATRGLAVHDPVLLPH